MASYEDDGEDMEMVASGAMSSYERSKARAAASPEVSPTGRSTERSLLDCSFCRLRPERCEASSLRCGCRLTHAPPHPNAEPRRQLLGPLAATSTPSSTATAATSHAPTPPPTSPRADTPAGRRHAGHLGPLRGARGPADRRAGPAQPRRAEGEVPRCPVATPAEEHGQRRARVRARAAADPLHGYNNHQHRTPPAWSHPHANLMIPLSRPDPVRPRLRGAERAAQVHGGHQ